MTGSTASGEYVALLDDDDEWLPEAEKQVRLLDSGPAKVGLIYTGFYKIGGSSKRIINEMIPHKRGQAFEAVSQVDGDVLYRTHT
jgi:glycosyltransferase involved in cell wall biosynthesis